jgi:hypothetical protein
MRVQRKVIRSAMAQRRASPKILSHSVNGEFVATAVALHSSRSVYLDALTAFFAPLGLISIEAQSLE